MKNWILLSNMLILVLSSCVKLPIHESKWYDENSFNNTFYKFYDADNKLRYDVFNDNENVYLRLNSSDRNTIFKILGGGLSIYFDSTGKKKQVVYLNFPIQNKGNKPHNDNRQNRMDRNSINSFTANTIERIPPNAIFINESGTKVFDYRKGYEGIDIVVDVDSTGSFYYYLTMPIEKIINSGFTNETEFSIGFNTGSIDMPTSGNRMDSGSKMPGGRNGIPVSSMPGGGHGGRPQRNMDQDGIMQQFTKPIKIWFKVRLKLESHNS
ncbi:hypothetical protein ACFL6I_05100 [candidate division KSB1 bacterium]